MRKRRAKIILPLTGSSTNRRLNNIRKLIDEAIAFYSKHENLKSPPPPSQQERLSSRLDRLDDELYDLRQMLEAGMPNSNSFHSDTWMNPELRAAVRRLHGDHASKR